MGDLGESSGGELRLFLAERDVACPNCGYNLKGLTAGRCPECDQRLALQIALAEPRFGAWMTCVLSLAAVGGLFFLGWIVVMFISIKEGLPRGREFGVLVVYPLCASLLCLPVCAFFVRSAGRRWLRRRAPESVKWVVLACVLIPGAMVLAWAVWVMLEM